MRIVLILIFILLPTVAIYCQVVPVNYGMINRLRPTGGIDVSGIWTFVETPLFEGKSFVLIQVGSEIFGVVNEKKHLLNDDKHSHSIYGTIEGTKVALEIAPLDISSLAPDAPMTDEEKRWILSRAVTKCEFEFKPTSYGGTTLEGKIFVWTYSPGTDNISHEKSTTGSALRSGVDDKFGNWSRRPGTYDISGRWTFAPNTYMDLWQQGSCVRGELTFNGNHYVLGHLEFDKRAWTNPDVPEYFSDVKLHLYEFPKTSQDYPAKDPVAYRRIVVRNIYNVSIANNQMNGKRATMDVGHISNHNKLAHVRFHAWQEGIVVNRETYPRLAKLSFWPLEDNYEPHYRTGFITTTANPSSPGINPVGTFRIRGLLLQNQDNAKVQTTKVRIYSDTDPAGVWVTLKETAEDNNTFWTEYAIESTHQDDEFNLKVRDGDRMYVTQQEQTSDRPLEPDDFAWTSGGGDGEYGAAITPLWRIPRSLKEYEELAIHYPKLFSADDVTEETSNNPVTGTYWANLGSSNYATAEQVIVQLWDKIVSVSRTEKVPPTLVAAILLQNMRSMNYFDIEFDGGVFTGKSIGISQTPYYILQKIAREHGIQSLQWPKGTELSEARSKEILFDAELNPAVAAAHIKMLTEAANKWVTQSTASETMKKRLMDLFDINYFNGKSVLDFRMKEIAATVGYNVDQWQMQGAPEALPVDITSGYRRGIVIALEDIYNNLDQYGQLRPELYLTPRNYVEEVAFPGVGLGIVSPSDRLKPYRWFKAGDIIPNFYPDRRNLVKRSGY